MTLLSSFFVIDPSPSLSKSAKASLNSEKKQKHTIRIRSDGEDNYRIIGRKFVTNQSLKSDVLINKENSENKQKHTLRICAD